MATHKDDRDPYVRCELHCHHDLGAGMSVSDLLGSDGPHPVSTALRRVSQPILIHDARSEALSIIDEVRTETEVFWPRLPS